MHFKRTLRVKKNRRSPIRHTSEVLRRNAITLLFLFAPSLISFFAGVSISRTFGAPFQALYEGKLLAFFASPFYGVRGPIEYLFRILFFSSTAFTKATFLSFSSIAKKRHRAVCTLLCIVQFGCGLYYPVLESARLASISLLYIQIYKFTELTLSALFFVYAYRLTRCFAYGFPSKVAPPHAIIRFFSYTVRLLIGILFLVTLRTVIVAIRVS